MAKTKSFPTETLISQIRLKPINEKLEIAKEVAKMIAEEDKELERDIEEKQTKRDLIKTGGK